MLQEATRPISEFIAAHYDPRADDNPELAEQFALLLFEWRERAWRNAEALRFIRVASDTGLLDRAKLAEIRAEALAVVRAIVASDRDTPAGRAMRGVLRGEPTGLTVTPARAPADAGARCGSAQQVDL